MQWTKEKEDAVFECLNSLEWVRWKDKLWFVDKRWLVSADSLRLRLLRIYKNTGVWIDERRIRTIVRRYLMWKQPPIQYPELVLRQTPVYAIVNGSPGIWYAAWSENAQKVMLYFMPPEGDIQILPIENWPKGIYIHPRIGAEWYIEPSGEINDLLEYWNLIAKGIKEGSELSLSLMLPALLRQGNAIFVLVGGSPHEQEDFMSSALSLIFGEESEISLVDGKSPYSVITKMANFDLIYLCYKNKRVMENVGHDIQMALTWEGAYLRKPGTDEFVTLTLDSSVFICAAGLYLPSKLAKYSLRLHLERLPHVSDHESVAKSQSKALMGAFRLFQKAYHVTPPENLPYHICDVYWTHPRYRDAYRSWLVWAYRYAKVLGVEDQLMAYLERAGGGGQYHAKN
jgi:hypothetical protein